MLHLAFDFSLIFTRWNAARYYRTIQKYYRSLPAEGWPCFVLSNHDLGRSIKRWLFGFHKYEKARLVAVLMLTLKGTPFIYYGDEIGMENVSISKEQIRDEYGKIFYPFFKGRDRSRTPMQWDDSIYAGFSDTPPWLPVHSDYKKINVDSEMKDPHSILNLYRSLIKLRKTYKTLQAGDIEFVDKGKNGILSYIRTGEANKIQIIMNFTRKEKPIKCPVIKGELLLAAYLRGFSLKRQVLRPFEWVIILEREVIL
jgi:alpha-glucosidase